MRQMAYEKLIAALRIVAEEQSLADGKMPTEAELCETYNVSRQTARRAYQELVTEGLVRRYPGRGTFVTRRPRDVPYYRFFGSVEDLLGMSSDTEMEVTDPLRMEVNRQIATDLGLKDHTIMTMEVLRWHQGVRLSLAKIYLPPGTAEVVSKESFPPKSRLTVLGMLNDRIAGGIAGVDQEITAVPCPMHVADQLQVKRGKAMLLIARRYLDGSEGVVGSSITYYDPDVYTYRILLGHRDS